MVCDSCGYKNDNIAKNCRGCGIALKPAMSEEEVSSILDRLSDRSDALTVSRLDRIIKWVLFSLAPVTLVFCLIFSNQRIFGVISAISMAVAGVLAGYPKAMWEWDKSSLNTLYNADDATPNDLWAIQRKIMYWGLIIFAIALVILSFID